MGLVKLVLEGTARDSDWKRETKAGIRRENHGGSGSYAESKRLAQDGLAWRVASDQTKD